MKKFYAVPLAMAAILALSAPAMAQSALDFAALDADNNGVVTMTECTTAGLSEEACGFLDIDKDGNISAEEIAQYNAQQQ